MAKKPAKFATKDLTSEHHTVGRGVHQITVWWKFHFGPVCTVWGLLCPGAKGENVFLVIDSFTPPWARRKGARTFINNVLFEQAAVIVSSSGGSTRDGLRFMKARGYQEVPAVGMMAVRKPKKGK